VCKAIRPAKCLWAHVSSTQTKGSMAVHTAEVSDRALHAHRRLDADVGANRLPPSADLARQLAASSRSRRKAASEPAGAAQTGDSVCGAARYRALGWCSEQHQESWPADTAASTAPRADHPVVLLALPSLCQ